MDWPLILSAIAYMGLEYWLGKTSKVKSGSVLEILTSIGKQSLSLFVRRKAEGYILPPRKK